MNILKFATLDFVNKRIHFSNITNNNNPCNNCSVDRLMLRILNNRMYYPTSASKSTPVQPCIQSAERLRNTNALYTIRQTAATALEPETGYDVTAYGHTGDPLMSNPVTETNGCNQPASNAASNATSSSKFLLGDIMNIVECNHTSNNPCVNSDQM